MIASTDISIDGDTAWWVPEFQDTAHMADWKRGADRPCDHCINGEYPIWDRNDDEIECPDCDGTGQHWFDIETMWPADCAHDCDLNHYPIKLRVSVVEVIPVVELDGQPEGIACLDTLGNVWYPDIDREGEPVHYLKDRAVLPVSAAPGKYAVRLRVEV